MSTHHSCHKTPTYMMHIQTHSTNITGPQDARGDYHLCKIMLHIRPRYSAQISHTRHIWASTTVPLGPLQLTPIWTRIYNLSMAWANVSSCLKSATIVPGPKMSPINSLNDYHPVALTPVIMKCFERLIVQHIKDYLPPDLDPCQFAYRAKRSTDDATALQSHWTTWNSSKAMTGCSLRTIALPLIP